MNKVISVTIPYMIVIVSVVMNIGEFVDQDIVLASLMGLLIGIWLMSSFKTEGTKKILTMLIITFGLLIVMDVISFLYIKNAFPSLLLATILQIFIFIIIQKNKPKISMTYKYNFKNKKRRYF